MTSGLLDAIDALPPDWHGAGTLSTRTLRAVADTIDGRLAHTVETGTGRSTLMLSHLSDHHTVFAVDDGHRGGSMRAVKSSPLLNGDAVEWVEGPTQRTLPGHTFNAPLDLVLLDGPHAFPFVELEYFHLYPHLAAGGLLIVDDIHIPTVRNLWRVLREDVMFEPVTIARTTGILRRTDAPTFNPEGDGWHDQAFNARRFPAWVSPSQWVRDRAVRVRNLLRGHVN